MKPGTHGGAAIICQSRHPYNWLPLRVPYSLARFLMRSE